MSRIGGKTNETVRLVQPQFMPLGDDLWKAIGFSHLGLGFLASLRHHTDIVARVAAAFEVVGPDLHVLGIGAISTLRRLRRIKVASVDTARKANLSQPLPCDCPICFGGDESDLLRLGWVGHVFARTLTTTGA